MSQLNAYLTFDGNCAEAMQFYQSTLGGQLNLMTVGQSPAAEQCAPGDADKIMHANLILDGGGTLMASDNMGGDAYKGMAGFGLALTYPTVGEAQRAFDALAEGGQVNMPMGKTFWAESFGMLVDRFGVSWLINGEMSPPPSA